MKNRLIKTLIACFVIVLAVTGIVAAVTAFTAKDSEFTFNTPTFIQVNSTLKGEITNKTDYDAYMFEVASNGSLSLILEQENIKDLIDDGWHITVYKMENDKDKSMPELVTCKALVNTVTSSWGETGIVAGTYCIVVEAGTLFIPGEYELTVSFSPTETFEHELNDTKETATPLSLNKARYGSSCDRSSGTDTDWYYFELTSPTCVTVTFSHSAETMPTSGWNVTVLNDGGKTISDFTSKLNDTTLTTGTLGLKAGKYFVRVDTQVLSNKTYSVLVSSKAHSNFEFELNNSPAEANTLTLGTKMSGALAARLLGLDRDYFKFTVSKDCVATVSFTHASFEGDKAGWNVRLLREENGATTELVRKTSVWNKSELLIDGIGLSAGTYYICIDADSLAYNSGEYGINVTTRTETNFETEPNNTLSSAKSMNMYEYYRGALISSGVDYDVDFYKFTLSSQTRVSVEFGHEAVLNDSRTGWTISVLDANGKKVFSFDSTRNRDFVSSEVVTLAKGTYYIRIENGLEAAETPYEIRMVGK